MFPQTRHVAGSMLPFQYCARFYNVYKLWWRTCCYVFLLPLPWRSFIRPKAAQQMRRVAVAEENFSRIVVTESADNSAPGFVLSLYLWVYISCGALPCRTLLHFTSVHISQNRCEGGKYGKVWIEWVAAALRVFFIIVLQWQRIGWRCVAIKPLRWHWQRYKLDI